MVSLIRRVWPQIIANSIIGVQPILGKAGRIFKLKEKYSRWQFKMVDKRYFKEFLRLNDRRRCFSVEAIKKAGYPLIELNDDQEDQMQEIVEWCAANIGKYKFIHNDYDLIAFSDEHHATMFRLAWN